jgi:hypothetical protein
MIGYVKLFVLFIGVGDEKELLTSTYHHIADSDTGQ